MFIRNNSRYKHNILSDSVSLNDDIDDSGTTIESVIDSGINIVSQYSNYMDYKSLLSLKYDLPFLHSLIFELRLNNFSNKEISILLDIKYKSVDNAITSIKSKLKKELNKIALC